MWQARRPRRDPSRPEATARKHRRWRSFYSGMRPQADTLRVQEEKFVESVNRSAVSVEIKANGIDRKRAQLQPAQTLHLDAHHGGSVGGQTARRESVADGH